MNNVKIRVKSLVAAAMLTWAAYKEGNPHIMATLRRNDLSVKQKAGRITAIRDEAVVRNLASERVRRDIEQIKQETRKSKNK